MPSFLTNNSVDSRLSFAGGSSVGGGHGGQQLQPGRGRRSHLRRRPRGLQLLRRLQLRFRGRNCSGRDVHQAWKPFLSKWQSNANLQGVTYARGQGWVDLEFACFLVFNSSWTLGNLAELYGEFGNIVEHLLYQNHPVPGLQLDGTFALGIGVLFFAQT